MSGKELESLRKAWRCFTEVDAYSWNAYSWERGMEILRKLIRSNAKRRTAHKKGWK